MRIVHAVVSERFAGVEQYVARLAGAQAATGHQVTVLGGDQEAMATAAGPEVEVRPAPSARAVARGLTALASRADVVNAHMTASELGALPHARSTPLVATRHFPSRRGSTPARRLALRLVRPMLAAQISVSDHVADSIAEPSTVVRPGLPPRERVARRSSRSLLIIGRLEPEKQVRVGIGAFAASGLATQGWTLSLIGDGSCRPALEAEVSRRGLAGAVHFHGQVTDTEPLLEAAHAVLAPCPVEALGLAVLEAMAAGLPVVAAGAGGHLETVGAVCPELTFAPGDGAHAGTLLRRIADAPAIADTAGRALHAHQRRCFTLERQVTDTDRVYRAVAR